MTRDSAREQGSVLRSTLMLLCIGSLFMACSRQATEPSIEHQMRLTASASLTRGYDATAIVAATLHVTNLADSSQRVWYGDAPCVPPLLVQIRDATGARVIWNATDAYRS